MSKLTNIQAVSLSSDSNTIAVLDKSLDKDGNQFQQLLFFKMSQNGNVVPFSVNSESIISKASKVAFGGEDEVLVILNHLNSSEVISFKLSEDSRSPVTTKRPQNKSIVKSENPTIKELKDIKNVIYDKNSKSILIYDSVGNFSKFKY